MAHSPHEITQLVKAWSARDKLALDDLHRFARRHMAAEREGHTLQTTALVHEAHLRLVDTQQATWKGREHFFADCAGLMRHILVDAVQSRRALQRGADPRVVELDEAILASARPAVDLIALDDVLSALAVFDARVGLAKPWLRRKLDGEGRHVA